MHDRREIRLSRLLPCLLLGTALITGCGPLPKAGDNPLAKTYLLEKPQTLAYPVAAGNGCRTLMVSSMRAAPGYTTARIAYVQQDHQLGYFAYHKWVDTPANMLSAILAQVLDESGMFRAVITSPAAVNTDFRLESELLYLQQVYTGGTSALHMGIRVTLTDRETREVLVSETMTRQRAVLQQTPYGAVVAANQLVAELLPDILALLDNTVTDNQVCPD